ncbi:hypothetical protein FNF29_08031 [Cafeteria roenbergensis]|uniref:Peptide-methionine (R)-S-oxide reductase n=1 Tax=Cafeteria roenbergensis TaxID=33653 RepID=A0A5A8C145_CAFRO|nr:hypothetical protein FNF29_08031 [Cafeteria roenbergensis]|eukprot:KAA0146455.1 hypothetical protein FNF29_08031 [Cafeteria roenbergensis]
MAADRAAVSASGFDLTPMREEDLAATAERLTPLQRKVNFSGGTEGAFTGASLKETRKGTYVSAVSGVPLFRSDAKFDSGTGWPSFFAPIDPEHVKEVPDRRGGLVRIEVVDAKSGAHLGHRCKDATTPSGQRYCMNSASLRFIPDGEELPVKPVA